MLGNFSTCRNSLGATPSNIALPERYLNPMTKEQIDAYILKEWNLGNKSYLASACKNVYDAAKKACLNMYIDIERANLYFVNGLIPHDKLIAVYKKTEKEILGLPVEKSFKDAMKISATIIVAAVAGFIAAGPIGVFTGSTAAVQKMVSDSRAKKRASIQKALVPQFDTVVQTATQKTQAIAKQQNQQAQARGLATGIGALTAAGIVLFIAARMKGKKKAT
jgi:hypothetical protein